MLSVLNIATSQSSDSNILLRVVLMKMMTYLTKALIKNWTSINLLVHWRNHSRTAPVWRQVSGCSTSSSPSSSPPSPRVSPSSVLSSLYIPLPRCCRTDDLTSTHVTTLRGAPLLHSLNYGHTSSSDTRTGGWIFLYMSWYSRGWTFLSNGKQSGTNIYLIWFG